MLLVKGVAFACLVFISIVMSVGSILSASLYHLRSGSSLLFRVVCHDVLCQMLQTYLFLWLILSFCNVGILLIGIAAFLLDFCWSCVRTVPFVCVQCYLRATRLFVCVRCYLRTYSAFSVRTITFMSFYFEPFSLNILNIFNAIYIV